MACLFLVLCAVGWRDAALPEVVSTRHASAIEPSPVVPAERVPILLYHHIAVKTPQNPYFVSPETLTKQFQWLCENHYSVISLPALTKALQDKTPLPEHSVVLTFDDGDKDQVTNALPILKQFGYTATFYIITGHLHDAPYMDEADVRLLHDSGMTVASHTVTHPNLARMAGTHLREELSQSKQVLESIVHTPVTDIAYPGGAFSSMVEEEAKKVGYVSATTTRHRFTELKGNENLLALPRIHIDDDLESFVNWIAYGKGI